VSDPARDPSLDEWVQKVKELPDLRWDKIEAVRTELAAGDYDVEARLLELLQKLPEERGHLAAGCQPCDRTR
jgi:hypothetical protein